MDFLDSGLRSTTLSARFGALEHIRHFRIPEAGEGQQTYNTSAWTVFTWIWNRGCSSCRCGCCRWSSGWLTGTCGGGNPGIVTAHGSFVAVGCLGNNHRGSFTEGRHNVKQAKSWTTWRWWLKGEDSYSTRIYGFSSLLTGVVTLGVVVCSLSSCVIQQLPSFRQYASASMSSQKRAINPLTQSPEHSD